jgi:hypothetical protein
LFELVAILKLASLPTFILSEDTKTLRVASISAEWRMFTLTGIHHKGEEALDLIELEKNFRELRKNKTEIPKVSLFCC